MTAVRCCAQDDVPCAGRSGTDARNGLYPRSAQERGVVPKERQTMAVLGHHAPKLMNRDRKQLTSTSPSGFEVRLRARRRTSHPGSATFIAKAEGKKSLLIENLLQTTRERALVFGTHPNHAVKK